LTLPHRSLPDLLRASAGAHPDGVALRDATGAWTYREVWPAVRALAERLCAHGVGPGDLVGLVARRRAGAPVAMAAVMAAGAAYVPVDPAWPPARQQSVAEACQPKLIAAVDIDTTLTGRLGAVRLGTTDLLRPVPHTAGSGRMEAGFAGVTPGTEALAYVIFTSGSTGRPKGVQVTDRAAANVVSSVARLVGLDDRSRLVALSSFAFDVSVFEIFGTWAAGAELVVADEDQLYPRWLAALLASDRPTYTQTTPSVLAALLDAGLTVPAGTVLLLAGERLPYALVQRVAQVRQVWNLYGPTEATIYATAHACLPLPNDPYVDPPIGRPVAGAVLDIRPYRAGSDVGELLIGGPNVACGYLGQPELSAQVFLSGPAGRRYRTGDVVARRADGSLAFLGRTDRQVKIRGNRVELDEIEAVAARLLGHRNVAVEAVEDGHVGTHVAAFVQASPGGDLASLRDRIAELLPAYLVPTKIYQIERLPMTSSGKIDRKALAGFGSEVDSGAVERWLADLWRKLLDAEVTPESNFYALGGHSLVAMRVAAEIEDTYGVDIGTNTVLRYPVLSALAREIAVRRGAAS
jgi:amino acid adenylation domain-containing protein